MTLSPGARLGPYEIVGLAGAGGMGEVYRAKDTRLDREVAVKVLPAHVSRDADRRARFEREARAVSGLNHPHVCTLYDVGRHDGIDYIVMEYLEGESLADRLKKGPLPVEEALRHAVAIADALDKAHRRGIVHRDLKPGNVVLTKAGAKLLDFGLAKLGGAGVGPDTDGVSSLPTEEKPLTEKGTLLGTYQYMAPEQIEGAEADARSDIFAFGALLYEMVSGKRAFEGKSRASLIAAILEKSPPPLASLQPMTPPALDRVVRVCLAKDPDERWQSAHDVVAELRWISEGGSQAGLPAPVTARRRSRERWAWAVAAAVSVLAAGLGAASVWRAPKAPRVVRAFLPAPEGVRYYFTSDFAGPAVVSPDGSTLAFVAVDANGKASLWARALDAVAARPIPGTEGATFPFWSPDSRSVGFFAAGKLKRTDLAGGAVTTICDAPTSRGGAWSPGGLIVYTPEFRSGLFVVSASGGTPRPLTQVDKAHHTSHRWPVFLPDGDHFLYLAVNHDVTKAEEDGLYFASVGGEAPRLLLRSRANAAFAGGRLLFLRDTTLMAQPFDPARGVLRGDAVPLTDSVQTDQTTWRAVFDASGTDVLVYRTGGTVGARLAWLDRSGKELGTVGEKDVYTDVRLSPDGKRAAVARKDPADIWVLDAVRGTQTRLTFEPSIEIVPSWWPGGRDVLYSSTQRPDGESRLCRKAADGGGSEEVLLASKVQRIATDVSFDGRFVLYVEGDFPFTTRASVWALPLAGDRKPVPVVSSPFSNVDAQFSPDARFVAYDSDETGRPEVYVVPFSSAGGPGRGGKWQISASGGFLPRWRRDGKELFYLAPDNRLMAVSLSGGPDRLEPGVPTALFRPNITGNGYGYDVSPEGDRFLVVTAGAEDTAPLTLVLNWGAELKR